MQRVLALALLSSFVGCGGGHYLTWRAAPPAPTMAGKLAIEIQDKREPKKGGERPEQIGLQTGSFGIPTPIRLPPNELVQRMHDFVTQAAMAAGVGVVAPGQEASASTKVVVEVQTFWCTGYSPAYKANITAGVMVVDPATGQVRVAAQPLIAEAGGMNCQSIYRKLLSNLFENARTMFAAGPVREGAVGNGVAPAAGAPAAQ
jgi:hypothetical protein